MTRKPLIKAKLIIRLATTGDIPGILSLAQKVYPGMPPYHSDQLRGQINHFPAGQFVAVYEGQIAGYAASFITHGSIALKPHTWKEITSMGYAARHDPKGDYLYGMEIFVNPDQRGLRIGRRFYEERKKLCRRLRLKGIVIAGRLPGLKRRLEKFRSVERYIAAVKSKEINDQVLSFQLRNGFEIEGLLKNYLPFDEDSLGYAILLVWRNASENLSTPASGNPLPLLSKSVVRVTTVNYQQRRISSFQEFNHMVEYFVDVASDYHSDFIVFPEWFTLQLLSLEKQKLKPKKAIWRLTEHTEEFIRAMEKLALRHNINIIAGTTAVKRDKRQVENCCYVFLRDGSIFEQAKLHPTPNERYWWDIQAGNTLSAIQTDCGPIGVLVCYDAEFPEVVRHLVDQGIRILFVPFCTDERQSYLRVRYCCHSRAIENQIYVVMSGNVGNLPMVENMDIQYGQSCILTPCDFPFARDGIAADTTPNVESIAVADLRLDTLLEARNSGTVQNLKNRRHDLYQVVWKRTASWDQ